MTLLRKTVTCLFLVLCVSTIFMEPASAVVKNRDKNYGELKEDMALVYFIRTRHFVGGGAILRMFADDQLLGVLANNSYMFAYLKPGRHLLWGVKGRMTKDVELIPGKTYYMTIWGGLRFVDEEKGRRLIGKKIKFYVTPTPEEIKKAAKAIKKYYVKARKRERKKKKAEIEEVVVTAPTTGKEGMLKVPAYTEINLELMENVTSYLNQAGDGIWFRVAGDAIVDGRVYVKKGTPVNATILQKKRASMGGVKGNFEITVPGIRAGDGTMIPIVGRIEASGKQQAGKAAAVGTATGVASMIATGGAAGIFVLAVRGKEAFFPLGQGMTVYTREDVWVSPTDETEPSSLMRGAPKVDKTLAAVVDAEVKFSPQKHKRPKDIAISLKSDSEFQSLEIYAVGELALVDMVAPKGFSRKEGTSTFLFEGWDLVRYVPLIAEKVTIPVKLRGILQDGRSFVAEADLTVSIKIKK